MPFITDPNQETGKASTSQITKVFSNGYKAGINNESEIDDVLNKLIFGTKWYNSPIPDHGYFFIYDYKTQETLVSTSQYFINQNVVSIICLPEGDNND
jgi:hypothetical protein